MPMLRRPLLLALLAAPFAPAQAQESPSQAIERLDAALLDVMRNAKTLGVRGRYARLRPVMEQVFNLPVMARIAVGPPWTQMTPEQQQAVQQAFAEWSIATYAARFDGYSGESFQVLGENRLANGDVLVRTQLNRPNDSPVQLNYLMRQFDGSWRIVDVYLTGTISELASRRSEFSAILREGGPDRLVQELRQRTQKLLAG